MPSQAANNITNISTTMQNPAVVTTQPQQGGGAQPPPGAPAGGHWVEEKYCGPASWIIGCFLCFCVVCCPIDKRTVYMVGGKKYNMIGAQI